MKVLASALACNPYLGSEAHFGWSAVKCLAQDHDLWVITGSRSQSDLKRAASEGLIPKNVHIGKFKEWNPNLMLARFQDWKGYMNFARESLAVATELHRKEKFDLVHHLTIATWRGDRRLYIEAALNAPIHHLLFCLRFLQIRRRARKGKIPSGQK